MAKCLGLGIGIRVFVVSFTEDDCIPRLTMAMKPNAGTSGAQKEQRILLLLLWRALGVVGATTSAACCCGLTIMLLLLIIIGKE